MPPQRRQLRFNDLSEIMPEVRRLLDGHRTLGNWTLGQTCRHLADSFTGSLEGMDLRNHRIKRFFLRHKMLNHALTRGIPRDYTVDANLTPPPAIDDHDGVQALGRALERYVDHRGPLHAHPLFGNMPRDTWDRVHCVHCAHHLSFVLPETP